MINKKNTINETEKPQEEGKRYVDMTQTELTETIKEEEKYQQTLITPRDWDIKDIEEANKEITNQDKRIAEKKEEYFESIKINKKYKKEAQKKLKKAEENIQFYKDCAEHHKMKLDCIKDIKKKLEINPNYYKEDKQ